MNEYQQLKEYLTQDPDNQNLRIDCAEAAINEKAYDDALDLLKPLVSSGNPKSLGLLGLMDLQRGEFENAEKTFAMLMEGGIDEAGLRFNRAWALASLKDFESALEILTDEAAQALPQAAMLRVQLCHQLGNFDKAEKLAREYLEIFPDYDGLLAASSTIAMDVDDPEWAAELAKRAPNHPEAKITTATLLLSIENAKEASKLFDEVLEVQPNAARALIGKGLSEMLLDNSEAASKNLDQGAESFGTHLGSWIAAGWSYAMRGDLETARERFEHTLSIDDTFSETHGSLGVLSVLEGDTAKAQKSIRTARRLDPHCASAALGQILILQSQGRMEAAKDIFDKAMNTPIDESGKTLSQAMISIGMS